MVCVLGNSSRPCEAGTLCWLLTSSYIKRWRKPGPSLRPLRVLVNESIVMAEASREAIGPARLGSLVIAGVVPGNRPRMGLIAGRSTLQSGRYVVLVATTATTPTFHPRSASDSGADCGDGEGLC